MKFNPATIRGILIDIAGTLEFKNEAIPEAIETISWLKNAGYQIKLLTNTDSKDPRAIVQHLLDYGFPITEKDIFTPIVALRDFILAHPEQRFYLLTTNPVRRYLEESIHENLEFAFDFDHESGSYSESFPDYTVICDFSEDWKIKYLDQAFQYVSAGSTLIGSQGNRYFLDDNGFPRLDTGSFVEMIRRATGSDFQILGKPAASFFLQAAESIGIPPEETLVIGDDIESDILGGQEASMWTALVETGKGKRAPPAHLKHVEPSCRLLSFSDVKKFFDNPDPKV